MLLPDNCIHVCEYVDGYWFVIIYEIIDSIELELIEEEQKLLMILPDGKAERGKINKREND